MVLEQLWKGHDVRRMNAEMCWQIPHFQLAERRRRCDPRGRCLLHAQRGNRGAGRARKAQNLCRCGRRGHLQGSEGETCQSVSVTRDPKERRRLPGFSLKATKKRQAPMAESSSWLARARVGTKNPSGFQRLPVLVGGRHNNITHPRPARPASPRGPRRETGRVPRRGRGAIAPRRAPRGRAAARRSRRTRRRGASASARAAGGP